MLRCFSTPAPSRSLASGQAAGSSRQQQAASAAAESARSLFATALQKEGLKGLSLSGGGFLLPYFIGVLEVLVALGLVRPTTHLAGSSAGSLIAVGLACGISPSDLLASLLAAADDCRARGVRGRLSSVLRAQLEAVLPADAHERCSGGAHVGLTHLPTLKCRVVSHFHDRQDLISALLASCHIPIISTGRFSTKFRKWRVVDGGLTALLPMPPSEKVHAAHVVKVSCLSKAVIAGMPMLNKKAAVRGSHFIAPGEWEPWTHSLEATFKFALHPGSKAFLLGLVAAGRRDAQAWLATTGLQAQLSGGPARALAAADEEAGLEAEPAAPTPLAAAVAAAVAAAPALVATPPDAGGPGAAKAHAGPQGAVA